MAASSEITQLLIAEHAHLSQSFLDNEQDGERRATFFLTFTAGVLAGTGLVLGDEARDDPATVLAAAAAACSVLLTLGVLTFRRLIHRNLATDRYLEGLARIRRHFFEGRDDPHLALLLFDPFEPRPRRRFSPFSLGRGGWLQVIAITNALLCAAVLFCLGALLPGPPGGTGPRPALALALAALPAVWFSHALIANRIYGVAPGAGAEEPPARAEA